MKTKAIAILALLSAACQDTSDQECETDTLFYSDQFIVIDQDTTFDLKTKECQSYDLSKYNEIKIGAVVSTNLYEENWVTINGQKFIVDPIEPWSNIIVPITENEILSIDFKMSEDLILNFKEIKLQ